MRLRQEDGYEFEDCLGYTVSLCLKSKNKNYIIPHILNTSYE